MSTQEIYFITSSVMAVMTSIFFVVLIVFLVKLSASIRIIRDKITTVADDGIEAAEEAKVYVNKLGKTVLEYITIKALGSIKKK